MLHVFVPDLSVQDVWFCKQLPWFIMLDGNDKGEPVFKDVPLSLYLNNVTSALSHSAVCDGWLFTLLLSEDVQNGVKHILFLM